MEGLPTYEKGSARWLLLLVILLGVCAAVYFSYRQPASPQVAAKAESQQAVVEAADAKKEPKKECDTNGTNCEIVVTSSVEFMTYLKNCSKLDEGLTVRGIWEKPISIEVGLTRNAEGDCFIFANQNFEGISMVPKKCQISKEEIAEMTTPKAFVEYEMFDKGENPSQYMDYVTMPIKKCIGKDRPDATSIMSGPVVENNQ